MAAYFKQRLCEHLGGQICVNCERVCALVNFKINCLCTVPQGYPERNGQLSEGHLANQIWWALQVLCRLPFSTQPKRYSKLNTVIYKAGSSARFLS